MAAAAPSLQSLLQSTEPASGIKCLMLKRGCMTAEAKRALPLTANGAFMC